ncbi:CRS1 / YhbY (CRM) domain-containing protein [Striga asiatica]|uniref:CRS1 / YhbY (CRM) domain-containing protein n=1 Tax=Striga asiatica TaxID=4170 RepID=A0A5A7QTR3_STRAF|nr:CRS1 / YhbY (CRM) domain-containing protein [Striga asiatica]
MALSTAKLTELPPHLLSTFSIPRRKPPHSAFRFFKPLSSSLRSTNNTPKTPSKNPDVTETSSSWIKKWPSPPPKPPPAPKSSSRKPRHPKTQTAPMGLGCDDEGEEDEEGGQSGTNSGSGNADFGDEKLGDLLKRDWIRRDSILREDEGYDSDALLPWERGVNEDDEVAEDSGGAKKRAMRAPTLAELTIEDEELRRLRRMGMTLRERISVPKAGLTGAVLEKIHDKWRKSELVRLKFHEELAHDMRTAHEIVEVGEF